MIYKVYLAGQMAPDRRTVEWRKEFTLAVSDVPNIEIEDPSLSEAFNPDSPGVKAIEAAHSNIRGKLIASKDRAMVEECNIIVANLNHYDHDKIIVGTIFELAWAYDSPSTTVIVIGDPELAGPILKHPFITSTSNTIVKTTAEAVELVRWISGIDGLKVIKRNV